MTRMEKYKAYRDEIAKSSKLGQSISLDNQNIEKYRVEINKLNPAILSSMQDETMSLHKGVTEINISEKQVPIEVSKLFSTLNKAKNTINQDNVNTIFFNLQNRSIIDKKHNIKEDWLKSNPDFTALIELTKEVGLDKELDTNVEKNLEVKYNSFTKESKFDSIEPASYIVKDDKKQLGHHIFVVSVTVAIIFFIITLCLLIARAVLW